MTDDAQGKGESPDPKNSPGSDKDPNNKASDEQSTKEKLNQSFGAGRKAEREELLKSLGIKDKGELDTLIEVARTKIDEDKSLEEKIVSLQEENKQFKDVQKRLDSLLNSRRSKLKESLPESSHGVIDKANSEEDFAAFEALAAERSSNSSNSQSFGKSTNPGKNKTRVSNDDINRMSYKELKERGSELRNSIINNK